MKTLYPAPSISKADKGFTLIEIIVVVAVIGILSLVVFASFEDSRKKGRDTARHADIQQLGAAVQVYGATYNRYPAALEDLVTADLFATLPTDPLGTDEYVYAYENKGNCFTLSAKSERSEETIDAGNCPTP